MDILKDTTINLLIAGFLIILIAVNVRNAGSKINYWKGSIAWFFAVWSFVLVAIFAIVLRTITNFQYWFCLFISVNFVTLIYFIWDRYSFKRKGWRIPNLNLHALAFFGATPVVFIGAILLKHKVRTVFFFQIILIMVLQITVIWFLNRQGLIDIGAISIMK